MDVKKKNISQLRSELSKNLTLDFFEDDEIAAILLEIKRFDKRLRQKILALCVALSGATSAFVPNTLKRIGAASRHLPYKDLERWITHAFDILDAQGTASFVKFTQRTDEETLRDFQEPDGLPLKRVHAMLEAYLRGISGMDLRVGPAKTSYTDATTVFLPSFMNRFEDNSKNLSTYKMALVHKWAQHVQGSLLPDRQLVRSFVKGRKVEHADIAAFFRLFPEKDLALDVYNILEAFRHELFLSAELPGLMREAQDVRRELLENRLSLDVLSEKTAFVEGLYQFYLAGEIRGAVSPLLQRVLDRIPELAAASGPGQSMTLLHGLYPEASALGGKYEILDITIILGKIEPEKVARSQRERTRKKRKKIEGVISRLIEMPEFAPERERSTRAAREERQVDPLRDYLLIKGKLIEIDEDLQEVIHEKGGLPGGVLVRGSDYGQGSPLTIKDLTAEEDEEEGKLQRGGIKYDEWDYRRGDYKRQWCRLFEHDIFPGHEPFVELTLQRYGGYVGLLRKRFELLKREPKLLRRQRDGDHVDIDCVVEAFSDIQAGLSPSENLFVKLDRQERNIAVLFLLDMSGSTKGWVNQAEKEALVLMSEALEALGDRYAIYGFSGMTRSKCDFYRIKGFDEPYAESIKRRIAGIQPKDYTRMGPPLRHSARILNAVEARTKLLITLSDGKPEDWDTYRGDYGIEDTRKALFEAKEKGIYPFCITIDTEASTYLPHMYGEARYIFIDDVRKLPGRITEIYRMLTT